MIGLHNLVCKQQPKWGLIELKYTLSIPIFTFHAGVARNSETPDGYASMFRVRFLTA